MKNLIGIDIDSNAIRALSLGLKSNGNYQVNAYASLNLTDCDNNLLVALDNIRSSLSYKKCGIATALPSSRVTMKTISLKEKLRKSELKSFLSLNAERYLGQALPSINLDYHIRKKNDGIDIKLVAASKKEIIAHQNLFKKTNLIPKIIDVDIFALARSVLRQTHDCCGIDAIVNIDSQRFLLCVVNKGEIIPIAFDYSTCQSFRSIDEIAETINEQLKNCASTHLTRSLFVSGTEAKRLGLIAALTEKTNIATILVDPFSNIEVAPKVNQAELNKVAPAMMISFGLALRKFL